MVGKGADSLPMQSGGWSLTWQGDNTKTSDYPNADTLLAAMRKSLGAANVDYSPDGAGVDPARYSGIVMVAAEKPYAETAGDIVFPASLRHSSRYPEDLAALERGERQGRSGGHDLVLGPAGVRERPHQPLRCVRCGVAAGHRGDGARRHAAGGSQRPPRVRL